MKEYILTYPRDDGQVGVRNYILVLSTVVCANRTAELVGSGTFNNNIITLTHQHGCTQAGKDQSQTLKTLQGIAINPNVAAVLIVGLGCETTKAELIAQEVAKTGKTFEVIEIQKSGGIEKSVQKGRKIINKFLSITSEIKRKESTLSNITIGLECGGSDAFSGITANPAVGVTSDILINYGATVILSEVPEMIGAEHVLGKRAANNQVKDKLYKLIDNYEQKAFKSGINIREANPTPGNLAGGISTLEEKSLGCIYKGGTTELKEVIDYAEKPSHRGLVVMNTPGNDIESLSGMAAGGAQIMLFTTGRGTPAGSIVSPTIKIATNTKLYNSLGDIIDLNAGEIIDSGVSKEEFGQKIFDEILKICHGKITKAEKYKQHDFAINRIGPTY